MTVLTDLLVGINDSGIKVIDLTAPLSPSTPVLQLPEPFANTIPISLEPVSDFDDAGPMWKWNNIHTGEHTGTHVDAPSHWATGRSGESVADIPVSRLIGPLVVIDRTDAVSTNADFVLEPTDLVAWEEQNGTLPKGAWLIFRTGWSARSSDSSAFLNADDNGPHTPGISAAAAKWLAEESDIAGFGVETVGIDAGGAGGFDPPFPAHHFLLGANKYGLTQLQNTDQLPDTGAVLIVAPLPIVGGTGSPARVIALVTGA